MLRGHIHVRGGIRMVVNVLWACSGQPVADAQTRQKLQLSVDFTHSVKAVERAVEVFSASGVIRLVEPTGDSMLLLRRYAKCAGAHSHSITVVAMPRAQDFEA
jgi:predicted xylose isomerase-like sugar epimerase